MQILGLALTHGAQGGTQSSTGLWEAVLTGGNLPTDGAHLAVNLPASLS